MDERLVVGGWDTYAWAMSGFGDAASVCNDSRLMAV